MSNNTIKNLCCLNTNNTIKNLISSDVFNPDPCGDVFWTNHATLFGVARTMHFPKCWQIYTRGIQRIFFGTFAKIGTFSKCMTYKFLLSKHWTWNNKVHVVPYYFYLWSELTCGQFSLLSFVPSTLLHNCFLSLEGTKVWNSGWLHFLQKPCIRMSSNHTAHTMSFQILDKVLSNFFGNLAEGEYMQRKWVCVILYVLI